MPKPKAPQPVDASLPAVVSRVLRDLPPEAQPNLEDIRAYFADPNFKPNDGIRLFFLTLNMIALKVIDEQKILENKSEGKKNTREGWDSVAAVTIEILAQVLGQAKVNPKDLDRFNQQTDFKALDDLSNSLNDRETWKKIVPQCKIIEKSLAIIDAEVHEDKDFATARSVKTHKPKEGRPSIITYKATQFCSFLPEASKVLMERQREINAGYTKGRNDYVYERRRPKNSNPDMQKPLIPKTPEEKLNDILNELNGLITEVLKENKGSSYLNGYLMQMQRTLNNSKLNEHQKAERVIKDFKVCSGTIKHELEPKQVSVFMRLIQRIFNFLKKDNVETSQPSTTKKLTTVFNKLEETKNAAFKSEPQPSVKPR